MTIDHVMNNVGANLRTIRKLKGLSQTALGNLIGVSGQMVQKYETGQSQISSPVLFQLADKLDVDIRQFFDEGESYVSLAEESSSYEVELDKHLKELIRAYSQLNTEDKVRLLAMAQALVSVDKNSGQD